MGAPLGWNDETALCGSCREWLPLERFGRRSDPRYKRPVRSHCRACEYLYTKARYSTKRRQHNARMLLNYHVNAGNLARGSCEVCGEPAAEAHHDDYSRPLDVRWLCPHHHNLLHARRIAFAD